jgi:hypothetical protein
MFRCYVRGLLPRPKVKFLDTITQELDKKKKASQPVDCEAFYLVVPRDRIELPTRGFSVGQMVIKTMILSFHKEGRSHFVTL